LYMGTKINQSETTLLYNGIPLNFKVEKIYIVITYNNGHVLMCMHRTAAQSDGIGSKSFHGLFVPSEIHVYFLKNPYAHKCLQAKQGKSDKVKDPNYRMIREGVNCSQYTR